MGYILLARMRVKTLILDPQVEDARMAMRIFLSVREPYEQSLLTNEDVIAGLPQ